jgi:hypothetical protein
VTTAEHFDRWYADRVESPVADELARRMLALPADLQSTSLLSGPGLDEVITLLGLQPGQTLLDLAAATAWRSSGAPAAGSSASTSPP